MISSEEVSIALGAVLKLQDTGLWSSGLRIKLRGEQASAADSLEDANWLESVITDNVKRVETLVERLPGFPVDEKVVTELFWLVEKLKTLRFEQEKSLTQEPSKTSSSKEALTCNQDDAILPTESSQKSLRSRLEVAVDGWRQSYEASLQVRKSALEAAE
jgi:hypothetical protein